MDLDIVFSPWMRFVFGLAVGSFLNVATMRYDPNCSFFSSARLTGRSYCPHCRKTLRWFELIPLVSFVLQGGRCRRCGARLALQYPLVELMAGLIFVAVPLVLVRPGFASPQFLPLVVLWVVVFLLLLVVAVVDMRETIIPDEVNVALVLLGAVLTYLRAPTFGLTSDSFIGHYALLFSFRESIGMNRLVAIAAALLFFVFLVLVTRGRGMGMGDVKLSGALGMVFGWPDVLVIIAVAFILGSVVALTLMLQKKKTLKAAMPFGPFLSLGSFVIFLGGYSIVQVYFKLLGV